MSKSVFCISLVVFLFIFSLNNVFAENDNTICTEAEVIQDEIINETLNNKELVKPKTNLNYNYQSIERVPVKLSIIESVTTKKNDAYEGKELFFKVKNNVEYKDKIIITKGTIAKARIATYTTRGMNGVPAGINIEDFSIPGIDSNKMTTSYTKYGLNFSALVLPLKWVLTILPPLGTFTNFIVGTNAKITPKDVITLYYYPEWSER